MLLPPKWLKKAPCINVSGFVKVTQDSQWPNTLQARRAIELCTTCPVKIDCATEALTAGTVLNAAAYQPADDVIAAGVICTGDDRTTRELKSVIIGREYKPRKPRPDDCTMCHTPMCSAKKSPTPDTVPHHSKGVCTRCYQRSRYSAAA